MIKMIIREWEFWVEVGLARGCSSVVELAQHMCGPWVPSPAF